MTAHKPQAIQPSLSYAVSYKWPSTPAADFSPEQISEDICVGASATSHPAALHRPRLATRAEAAAYLALSTAGFDDWIRRGIIPGPISGTRRWDRFAIDAALDRASRISSSTEKENDYAAWKKAHAGSPARDSSS